MSDSDEDLELFKLKIKNIKQEMTFYHDQNDKHRLNSIIHNQNKVLLRDLAIHYNWNYGELCQKYLRKDK